MSTAISHSSSSTLMNYFFLDARYSLMTAKMVHILYAFFKLLDVHGCDSLNDLQFYHLMRRLTNLTMKQIYNVFDMLDTDGSGTLDFEEFYLLFCILIAQKDHEIKKFIHRHSRTVFDLLDTDGSNEVSVSEFAVCGFLFNFHNKAINRIFKEFDLSGDEELDYREFRLFTMACIDKQQELEAASRNRFRSQQIKEMSAAEAAKNSAVDIESRKSKLEALTAALKKSTSGPPPGESASPKVAAAAAETPDQAGTKRDADVRGAEAKTPPAERSTPGSETQAGKTKGKTEASKKYLESGKETADSPTKSKSEKS